MCSLCNTSWPSLKSSKDAWTFPTHRKLAVILHFGQYLLGVKICCTGTWGVLFLLSQTDEWVYRLTDQCSAGFKEVTAGMVRDAELGTPAPFWLTHIVQGVPTQRRSITEGVLHLLQHQKHQLLLDFGLNTSLPSWNQDSDKVPCTAKVFPSSCEKQELHRYRLGSCCAGFLWQLLEPSGALLGWGPL